MQTDREEKYPLVRHRGDVQSLACPYGSVERIVTGGDGGVANVHVVNVTEGGRHFHEGYDEVYYVLSGSGRLTIDVEEHELTRGSVAVIPAGHAHALAANPGESLEFIIFGSPAMTIDDERARPRKG